MGHSSKKFERDQLNAKYGARMQPLFEDDVRGVTAALAHGDIVVPHGSAIDWAEGLKSTTAAVHADPYGGKKRGDSEASYVSGFSKTSFPLSARGPGSEASYSFSQPPAPLSARAGGSEISFASGLSKTMGPDLFKKSAPSDITRQIYC